MVRMTTLVLALLLMAGSALSAADEKPAGKSKPVGTWKRTAGDQSITFTIKADSLRVVLNAGGNMKEVDADYGLSKDGVLFGRINHARPDGDGPAEGDLFSFRFRVEKDVLTISDLKTPGDGAEAKELVQGEYRKQ